MVACVNFLTVFVRVMTHDDDMFIQLIFSKCRSVEREITVWPWCTQNNQQRTMITVANTSEETKRF